MTFEEIEVELNWVRKETRDVLRNILVDLQPENILEIGSGWGFTARCFLEYSNAFLTTVDSADVIIDKQGRDCFKLYTQGFEERFEKVVGRSVDVVPVLDRKYDLVFIDGDHAFESVFPDIINAYSVAKDNGVIVLDDVWHVGNWETPQSCGVSRALSKAMRELQLDSCEVYSAGNGIAVIKLRKA